MKRALLLVALCALSLEKPSDAFRAAATAGGGIRVVNKARHDTRRFASDQDSTDMRGIRGMKGYYRRPSRAIEKGGGFFVPGLEGERIRILTAAALVLMYIANRAGQTTATLPQIVSELTGISVALLLFAQGAVDVFGTGSAGLTSDEDGEEAKLFAASYLSVLQNNLGADVGGGKTSSRAGAVESVARSLVQTSEGATYIAAICLADGKVLFELGPVQGSAMTAQQGGALLGSSAASSRLLTFVPADALDATIATCLPVGTRSVGFARVERPGAAGVDGGGGGGGGGLLWILASGSAVDEIDAESRTWMQTLLSAPV